MPPITIMLKPVSGNCNMCCSYCFYADELKNRSSGSYPAMTQEILERVIRRAFTYADHHISFVFQGGEPTLAGVSFFRNFLKLEKKYNSRNLNVNHAIQTNGLSVSDELMDLFAEGKFLVGVSIDGNREIHDSRRLDHNHQGTYERVMQTIGRLKERHIPYNILCVVDNEVARQPEVCYKQLKSHGYLQFIACLEPFGQKDTVLDPQMYGEFLIRTYQLYAKDFRNNEYVSVSQFDSWLNMMCGYEPGQCGMTGHCSIHFLIESNGDVYPCDFYALDQYLMGNVQEINFHKMILSDVAKGFIESSVDYPLQCKTCPWFSVCRNGCRRDREPIVPGQKLVMNRLCESYSMFFSKCYEDMKQLAAYKPPNAPRQ